MEPYNFFRIVWNIYIYIYIYIEEQLAVLHKSKKFNFYPILDKKIKSFGFHGIHRYIVYSKTEMDVEFCFSTTLIEKRRN